MKIIERDGDIIVSEAADFELADIFECGQCFRWNRVSDSSYFGVASQRALLLEKKGGEMIFHSTAREDFDRIWYDYFDFGRDYSEIKKALSSDPVLAEAIGYGSGIRILRQEAFETLISFIISASNNIPRIKTIIERLCENFGVKNEYMGKAYYSFPTPERIASLAPEELSVIRAGFRDKYILAAAKGVARGDIDLDAMAGMTAEEAKNTLMKIKGVGNKVSDCILLFGLAKCGSFPVDVWIKRIMEYCYFDNTERSISEISAYASEHFGELGGFAQQYLFFWARENKIGV